MSLKRFVPAFLSTATVFTLASAMSFSGVLNAFACSDHHSNMDSESAPTSTATEPPADSGESKDDAQTATPPSNTKPSDAAPQTEPLSPVQQGKILMETRCSSCHPAPRANTHTLSEWPAVLQRMARLASMKDEEVQQIQLYLEDTLKPQSRSDWDQPNG